MWLTGEKCTFLHKSWAKSANILLTRRSPFSRPLPLRHMLTSWISISIWQLDNLAPSWLRWCATLQYQERPDGCCQVWRRGSGCIGNVKYALLFQATAHTVFCVYLLFSGISKFSQNFAVQFVLLCGFLFQPSLDAKNWKIYFQFLHPRLEAWYNKVLAARQRHGDEKQRKDFWLWYKIDLQSLEDV